MEALFLKHPVRHSTSSDSDRAGCEPPQEQNSWDIRHASVIIKGRRSRQNPFIDQSTTKETSSLAFSCVIDTLLWSYRFNNTSIEKNYNLYVHINKSFSTPKSSFAWYYDYKAPFALRRSSSVTQKPQEEVFYPHKVSLYVRKRGLLYQPSHNWSDF